MQDFFYRTEDIRPDQILSFYVETKADRQLIESIKSTNPTVLVGSRGVGKSFLLRVAEQELLNSFDSDKVLPVYITFNKGILLNTADENQFHHWMMARICTRIVRALRNSGLLIPAGETATALTGGTLPNGETEIEKIAAAYESSWNNQATKISLEKLPSLEVLEDAIEDLCKSLSIKRISLLFDEVAHIFRPEQQRQFFTLFRDLRSPYLTCNAAVYPGVTSYGPIFQPTHDANFLQIERDILSIDYVENMREMVEKQADSSLVTSMMKNGENFAVLAYASHGNPRLLLKTITKCPKLSSRDVNEVIKEFYRSDIWSEHSGLMNAYFGHKELIDWGRKFIESAVLPDLQKKNIQYFSQNEKTTCYIWIHRDAPEAVKEGLRLLTYTGIINGDTEGIKATRAEIGTRYAVNLGCLFALESSPLSSCFKIAKNISPRRMSEFGANHSEYKTIQTFHPDENLPNWSDTLKTQLEKSVNILDITNWQKTKMIEAGLDTVGKILGSNYDDLRKIYYVGEVRSKRIYNAAQAAIYEYLSG